MITNFKIKACTHNLWTPFNFPIKLWLQRVSKHKKQSSDPYSVNNNSYSYTYATKQIANRHPVCSDVNSPLCDLWNIQLSASKYYAMDTTVIDNLTNKLTDLLGTSMLLETVAVTL